MIENEKDTLNLLLNVAREEFLERGYQMASLRTIAKKAGLTTGALYGHFKNKESLFDEIVGRDYNNILNMYKDILSEFKNIQEEQHQPNMVIKTKPGMMEMKKYIYSHRDSFKLILCCAEGTKYNNLVHEMAKLDADATHDFAENSGNLGVTLNPVNQNLEHMLISGMFSTFFEMIIHDIPEDEAEEYTEQLLTFYAAGWSAVMGI